jgi:hypothetical protein
LPDHNLFIVIPAEAGTHSSTAPSLGKWIPAFARPGIRAQMGPRQMPWVQSLRHVNIGDKSTFVDRVLVRLSNMALAGYVERIGIGPGEFVRPSLLLDH